MGARICALVFVVLVGWSSSPALASTPGRFVDGILSNALSALMKWSWTLSARTKTGNWVSDFRAMSGRPLVKFESGYTVETVFDGSKLGIEPFAVEIFPNGDILVLDSENSNIYKIHPPLSRYSRPKLIAGSSEGYPGHVDGRLREARMNHPKGFTVDDRGNIYVADTMNTAIRKISDTGVTTIAGGKWSRGGGHVDGPSEDAKFSDDFDVVYIGSSCSLLVVDRGNRAIREIQLHFEDCAYHYETGFPIGILVLVAAAFFGYILALLQHRVGARVQSSAEPIPQAKANVLSSPYLKPPKSSVRPPLIPVDGEEEIQEEGLFQSLGNLFLNVGASFSAIFGGLFSARKKPVHYQNAYHQQKRQNAWPMQESFVIQDGDEPPSIETRTPTPKKTYPFMSSDAEKSSHFRVGRSYHSGWDGRELQHQPQQHHRRHYSSGPHTYYEQSCETTTTEIVFGAVQEDGQRRTVEIKPLNYGDPIYEQHNVRSHVNYAGYNRDF